MQRRIERADSDRKAVHSAEHTDEVVALHGQQFLQRGTTVFLVVGENHRAHVRNLFCAEKHMFGATQSDAFCAERTRLDGVTRDVSIRAHLQHAVRIRPSHKLLQLGIVRRRIKRAQLAFDHAAGGAVERNPVARLEHLTFHSHLLRLFIDINVASARDAALAHAPRDHSRVAGHAAA